MLMAVGAVLRWAVTATTSGINLHVVGLVLLLVGLVGFIISIFWMMVWADRTKRTLPDQQAGYGNSRRQPPTPAI